MRRPMSSDGGLFPNRPGRRLHPYFSCTEQSGNTGSQPAENVRTPSGPSYPFSMPVILCLPTRGHSVEAISSRGEMQSTAWDLERKISPRVG